MRSIIEMDNCQIEITNACHLDCSNCTRLCGHHKKPYMMNMETFKKAVDSVVNYPKMVGIMGGEPLLHPKFKEFCEYALSKIPRERLALWSSFPAGKEHYAETIAETFGNILLNDHTRPDIYHAPILIGIEDLLVHREDIWPVVDKCWVQNSWSASINKYGAYFCEIAAAMAMLCKDPEHAWPVDSLWWKKAPIHFTAQAEKWCPQCGMAVPLTRRLSIDGKDDISPKWAAKLKGHSRKVDANKCVVHLSQVEQNPAPMASYKDNGYREAIAAKYGMHLTINERKYWEPHMGTAGPSLFDNYQAKYKGLIDIDCAEENECGVK